MILSAGTKIYLDIYSRLVLFLSRQKRLPKKIERILYICKGNVCRSVMAEFVSAVKASSCGLESLKFFSRGVDVRVSSGPEMNAILVCRKKGIEISDHLSMPVQSEDVLAADLILCMEAMQMIRLIDRYHWVKDKTFLLTQFSSSYLLLADSVVVKDPYGCDVAEFEKCLDHICRCIDNLLRKIKNTNNEEICHYEDH